MSLYNIEIFDQAFSFRSSYQVQDLAYEFDYLSLSNNKIKIPHIEVLRGDYIRIAKNKNTICGIVERVSESDTMTTIEFKNMLTLFDVKVYTDLTAYQDLNVTVEDFLADMLRENFIENTDVLQNITGLSVKTLTGTTGNKQLGIEEYSNNLLEMIQAALKKHRIVVNIDIDVQEKTIKAQVGQVVTDTKMIEADLPNIFDRNFTLEKGEEMVNKLTVIDETNHANRLVYYKSKNGAVSIEVSESDRITPVVPDIKFVSFDEDEVFEDIAYQEALEELTQDEYDNLIELTADNNDTLVKPSEWMIGERACVKYRGTLYYTVLTGIRVKNNRTKLIFGAVRLELTKKLKRRMTNV